MHNLEPPETKMHHSLAQQPIQYLSSNTCLVVQQPVLVSENQANARFCQSFPITNQVLPWLHPAQRKALW